MEKRTGLMRCYISRMENGHTVPSVETLEKLARALEVPMYRLFFDGDAVPAGMDITKNKSDNEKLWGDKGTEAKALRQFRKLFGRISIRDRRLLLKTAKIMEKL